MEYFYLPKILPTPFQEHMWGSRWVHTCCIIVTTWCTWRSLVWSRYTQPGSWGLHSLWVAGHMSHSELRFRGSLQTVTCCFFLSLFPILVNIWRCLSSNTDSNDNNKILCVIHTSQWTRMSLQNVCSPSTFQNSRFYPTNSEVSGCHIRTWRAWPLCVYSCINYTLWM